MTIEDKLSERARELQRDMAAAARISGPIYLSKRPKDVQANYSLVKKDSMSFSKTFDQIAVLPLRNEPDRKFALDRGW